MKERLKNSLLCNPTFQRQLIILCAVFALGARPVYADEIQTAFNNLQSIVASFVSSIGMIICLWGIFEFGNSMQGGGDGAMTSMALKRIGGGLVMIIAPQLLVTVTAGLTG